MIGTENGLNHVLSTFVDSEHEISNFCHSRYVHLSEVQSIFQNNPNEFLILTLNIQSVNAKFNNLFPVIDNLASQGLYFGAICLQETWTSTDSDLSLLQLPGYQLIHQGSKCTKHGGLMIYLNESYSYKIRNLFTNSNIYLSTLMEATFAVHSQLVTYTDLLTIIITMQIYSSLYRSSLQ